jgi:hypothetical protein
MNSRLQHSHTPSTGILFSRFTILNVRFAMPKVPHKVGPDCVLFSACRFEKAAIKPPPRAEWLRVSSTLVRRAFRRSS